MNLDRVHIKRTVYGILDLLGDVGGLATTLISSLRFAVLIIIFNFNKYELATLLYSRRELQDECVKTGFWDDLEPTKNINSVFITFIAR